MTKEEFEEKFDDLIQELELQPGERIDIGYMLGAPRNRCTLRGVAKRIKEKEEK